MSHSRYYEPPPPPDKKKRVKAKDSYVAQILKQIRMMTEWLAEAAEKRIEHEKNGRNPIEIDILSTQKLETLIRLCSNAIMAVADQKLCPEELKHRDDWAVEVLLQQFKDTPYNERNEAILKTFGDLILILGRAGVLELTTEEISEEEVLSF